MTATARVTRRGPIAEETVQELLAGVAKPARYTGGEVNSVVKPLPVRCRVALCFPDVYEVAESHLGLKILYHIINRVPDLAAERCYALWPDLEQRARAAGVPLWSLETYRPLGEFDIVGFTLQYELSYATLLAMLAHGGVTLWAAERSLEEPFVIGGGAGAFNPEPVADFFDAIVLGDAEEVILEVIDRIAEGRQQGSSRAAILLRLGEVDGVYVPGHYEVTYDGLCVTEIRAQAGTPKATLRTRHGTPRVSRAVVPDLDSAPYPERLIIPNLETVHERVTVEIQRGCSHSCRFCQAGMTTRPTRQRRPERVLDLAGSLLATSGCDEVGLLSLSAGDYGPLDSMLTEFFQRFAADQVGVSLPSLRTETMTPELAVKLATVRKSGFTLAPEAGSERLRVVINKTNNDQDLLSAVRAAAHAGWRQLKLYFMIGLPTETAADVDAIVDLALRARAAGREICSAFAVTVSVSTFVPKAHTPFQWEQQLDIEGARRWQQRLADALRGRRITWRYHGVEQSWLEGVLGRGDRRLGPALAAVARAGCRLDAWTEHHDHGTWRRILTEHLGPHGLTPEDYLRARPLEWLLPWDHLDAGVLKKFLARDRARALAAEPRSDCASTERCHGCGGCDIANPYLPKPRRRGDAVVRPRLVDDTGLSPGRGAAGGPSVPPTARTRFRFRFAKRGRALHLSQLALQEQIVRAIRLSRIPVVYSQGFTPRPRASFSPACPTGIVSEAEYFEITCHGEQDPPQVLAERLAAFLPAGLAFTGAWEIELDTRPVGDLIEAMTYVVARPESMSSEALGTAVESFRQRREIPVRVLRKKRARIFDARVQILDAARDGDDLRLTIAFGEHGTLKIREAAGVILGVDHATDLTIRKTDVRIATERPKRIDARIEREEELGEVLDLSRLGEHPTQPTTSRH